LSRWGQGWLSRIGEEQPLLIKLFCAADTGSLASPIALEEAGAAYLTESMAPRRNGFFTTIVGIASRQLLINTN
jgi:hypothetical protein